MIEAAKGVTPRLPASTSGTASQRDGRAHVDGAYELRPCSDTTSGSAAPCAGYWGPTAPAGSAQLQAHLANTPPGLYRTGETFDKVHVPASTGAAPIGGLTWQRFITIHRDQPSVAPVAVAGVAREVTLEEPDLSCAVGTPCPVTGVWQPWLAFDHPSRVTFNQPWRQAWLVAGQHFPNPWHGEQRPFNPAELTWHLMEAGSSSNA